MGIGLGHPGGTGLGATLIASFLASLVECVEALTVVLAVGSVRGWRSALAGAATALGTLAAIVAILGPALTRIPLHGLTGIPFHLAQFVVGTLILLFGLRWLRKAILRSAGLIPLHDEEVAFAKNAAAMRAADAGSFSRWDKVAFSAAFNITMLEGTEVVFIVIAFGASGAGLLLPASLGAVAALLVVAALGFALHRPLARIPENTLKFLVGVLLSALGTFWVGEGAGLAWPTPAHASADLAIPCLMAAYLALALCLVPLCRMQARAVAEEG
jgi:Ca2+/H+ antiporter, TMEM165/GDT1 family